MLQKVVTKYQNPQVSNLAIIHNDRYLNSMLNTIGALRNYEHAYQNIKYKDSDTPELYYKPHYEVPMPLIYRLGTKGASRLRTDLKLADWNEDAKELYSKAVRMHKDILEIKTGDISHTLLILDENDLDPKLFKRELREHQLRSLALHITLGFSNNWGQMRTGKTAPAMIYTYWLLANELIDLAIWVVPNSIKWNWYEEMAKDLPASVMAGTAVIEGTKSKKRALWERSDWIKITNYAALRADIDIVLEITNGKRILLGLDEAHNIKNHEAKQTMAVKELNPEYFFALSGTPVSDKPEDVFEPVHFTSPNLLSWSFGGFEREYCKMGGYAGTTIKSYKDGALKDIHNRMATISIRAKREDIGIGFGKDVVPAMLDMTKYMRDIHKAVNEMIRVELRTSMDSTSLSIPNFLAKCVRLQQVCAGYLPKFDLDNRPTGDVVWFDDKDLVKMLWIDKFLDDYLADIKKVVIFTKFIPVIKRLYARYQSRGAVYICGEIKPVERTRREKMFQSDSDTHIMICNMQLAHGMDFNPAEFCIFHERTFWFLQNIQAEDRITGINQTGDATIIPLTCKDSIDYKLEKVVLPRKRKNFDAVVDGKFDDADGGLGIGKQDLFDLIGGV